MASALQLKANRVNARFSSGPTSRGGKSRAARNARRHGLATSIWSDPGLSAEAELLALELAGPTSSSELQHRARLAAAAHVDVDRIRRARHQLIVQHLENPDSVARRDRGREKQAPEAAQKLALTISNLARRLAILERYERRALSRRKDAFRDFVSEQRKSK